MLGYRAIRTELQDAKANCNGRCTASTSCVHFFSLPRQQRSPAGCSPVVDIRRRRSQQATRRAGWGGCRCCPRPDQSTAPTCPLGLCRFVLKSEIDRVDEAVAERSCLLERTLSPRPDCLVRKGWPPLCHDIYPAIASIKRFVVQCRSLRVRGHRICARRDSVRQ